MKYAKLHDSGRFILSSQASIHQTLHFEQK